MARQWMEVCFLASGETVVVLDGEDFEGKPAQTLKQSLAARVGVPRFRQRLLLEGASQEILDDEVFSPVPSRVQLLVVNDLPPDAEQDEAMINACEENDPHALNQLLRGPRNPNVQDPDGQTLLAIAAAKDHVDIAQLLLEAGAQPDALSSTVTLGRRAAHVWSRKPRRVLRAGRVCYAIDGVRPLLIALWHRHVGMARMLLEAGAKQDLHNAASVLAAVQSGNRDLVRLLLEAGASPNLATEDGTTPLLTAVRQGGVAIVQLLLGAGACPNQARNDRETPLLIADTLRHRDISRLLLEAGARQDPYSAASFLVAVQNGNSEEVRLLLEGGASPNLATDDGTTPLLAAVRGGHVAIVRLLLEAGATPDQARNDHETPLFIATFLGHLDIVRLLLEVGAASNPVRKDGATPLFIAARQGHFDIARLLLESGADLGMARDFASSNGYLEAVAHMSHMEQLKVAG